MHPLDPLLRPRSIAMIGASADVNRGNGRTFRYLVEGGFAGPVYAVNARRDEVQGRHCYRSVAELPEPVDCAIVAVGAEDSLQAVRECARRGVRAAVLFAAGFAETGPEGAARQAALVAAAREGGMRLLGPNCLGLYDARCRGFMTFSSMFEEGFPRGGRIGMVTQSGGYGSQVRKLAQARGLELVQWVSSGNECDVDAAELIEAMVGDEGIDLILCYLEGSRSGPRLAAAFEAARRACKPVVAIKVGRSAAGGIAAASHTAALAGEDRVFEAVFRLHGVHRADSVEEMLDVAYALSRTRRPAGDSVVVLSVSGGFAVQMTDQAAAVGLAMPPVPADVQQALRASMPYAVCANPVDMTGQVLNDLPAFGTALDRLLGCGRYDAAAIFVGMAGAAPSLERGWRTALVDAARRHPRATLLLSIVAAGEAARDYEDAGFALFEDTARMMRAHAALVGFARAFERAAPAAAAPAEPGWPVLRPGDRLSEAQAKRVLAHCGIPSPREAVCADAAEAVAHAEATGFPVALKVVSADVPHKTEAGGVRLGLADAAAVRAAVAAIGRDVAARHPGARIDGFLVSPMLDEGVECLVGVRIDPVFGPVVLFGAGGVLAELLEDRSLRPAPVAPEDARAMVAGTRVARLLDGFRGAPPADLDALADAISRLSRFAAANAAALESVEINPLRVLPAGRGVVALDALIATRR